MIIFVIFAGTIGILIGIIRNKEEKEKKREAVIIEERKKLLEILNGFADGILITDQDYKIRYMNAEMLNKFGNGKGATCYQHLHKLNSPCHQECRLTDVISHGNIQKWECKIPGDGDYEVIATPYIDNDGSACQISLFKKS
jgi:PAS domain-containing protein